MKIPQRRVLNFDRIVYKIWGHAWKKTYNEKHIGHKSYLPQEESPKMWTSILDSNSILSATSVASVF